MADSKITGLTALTSVASTDLVEVVDVSDTSMAATGTNKQATVANVATAVSSALGLGSMATQASSNVTITGGSVSGITDLAVADGGTGASDAATARTNLGLVIGTNVQAHSAVLDATTASFTIADESKLDGLTQYTDEMARDAIGTALVAGANVSITVNDGADTITIAATAPGSALYLAANYI